MPDDALPTDTDPVVEVEAPEPAPAVREPARGIRLARALSGLALVALVALVVFTLSQRQRAEDLAADRDDRAEVATVAATFGEVYLTYDFADPDSNGAGIVELATPDFAEDFSSTRAPGIEELFANLETTTRASTTEVFVGDVSGDTARAFVVVDVEATSAASGTQELTNLTFVLDLLRIDGTWLVDAVNPAPQPDLAGDGAEDPAATTSTTAPAATTPTTAP